MSDTETWGIVLRDRASGAEQWIACEVTYDGDADAVTARAHGYGYRSVEYAQPAVEGVGRLILQHDRTLSSVRIATSAEYAAHMEGVCLTLAIDEANDLRAEVAQLRASIANREEVIADLRAEATRLADTIGAIGRRVCAESCERDVILDAIRERGEDAFRRGAGAMRDAAAACVESPPTTAECALFAVEADRDPSNPSEVAAFRIRALPLPAETPSQPAQSHEAPATPSAPLNVADATARARSAAAQRMTDEAPVAAPDADAWVETWTDAGPRGLRVIRAALATAAPERWQAERLCAAAGISRERVDLGGSPGTMWFTVIEEAVKSGRVSSLVAAARAKYPQCGL